MKYYNCSLLLFTLLFIISCTEEIPTDPKDPDPGPIEQEDLSVVDNKVLSFMEKYNIPGASIAISRNEEMVYAKGFGLSNTSTSEPVTTKSVFRIASISKMYTGVSILKLVEDGFLDLDEKVFGPTGILGDNFGTATLSEQELDITVDHLLHNSFGGWGVASGGDPIDYVPTFNNDQFIEYVLNNWDLAYPIENTFVYSNTGYWLLARIVEKISGQAFAEYAQNLFGLAEVSTLHFTKFTQDDRQENEVEYYGQDGEEQYIYSIAARRDGDGGAVISAPDLLRSVCALDKLPQRQDILTDETIELLRGNGPLAPNWGRGIGFWNEEGRWWTTGALPATRSWLYSTYEGMSMVMITNSKSNDSNFDIDYNQILLDIIYDSSIPWKDGLDQF